MIFFVFNISGLIDSCQLDNGNCSHVCHFNQSNLQFECSCPASHSLLSDMKTCVELRKYIWQMTYIYNLLVPMFII